jgi:hypothetical protein
MSDDATDLLEDGFEFLLEKTNPASISNSYGTAKLISTPIGMSKEMQKAGYWPQYNGTVELTRTDFMRLRIVDRSVVTYRNNAADKLTLELRVIGIENDGGDPNVRLTLKKEPGGKAG